VQLTKQTMLKLTISDDEPLFLGPPQRITPRSSAPGTKAARDRVLWAISLVLFGLTAVLLFQPDSNSPGRTSDPTGVRQSYEAIVDQLTRLRDDPQGERLARMMLDDLGQARLSELSGRSAEAFRRYVLVREELDRIDVGSSPPGPGPRTASAGGVSQPREKTSGPAAQPQQATTTADVVIRVRAFVHERLVALGEHQEAARFTP
jgi:hypothetical protein